MDKLLTKLVRLSKPVKVTDNKKDTLAYYARKLIMGRNNFYRTGPWATVTKEKSFITLTPGNRGTPVICGFNTGQHRKNFDNA